MHIALWIVQALLALAFIGAGASKTFLPLDELAQNMSFVTYTPAFLVRFIGVAELAGALGLILPAALRIKPKLTPLAALGLLTVMVLAAGTHLLHGEGGMIVPNLILGGLAAFVAFGRTRLAPITPK